MTGNKRFHIWVLRILFILFIGQGILLLSGIENPLSLSDSKSYWYTAGKLLDTCRFEERFSTGSTPTSWRPPMTSILLALFRWVGFQPTGVVYLNMGLVIVTLLGIAYFLGKLGIGLTLALIGSLIYILHPAVRQMTLVIMSETYFMAFLMVGFGMIARAGSAKRKRDTCLCIFLGGLCAGAALLTRTILIAFFPALVYSVIEFTKNSNLGRSNVQSAMKGTLFFFLGFCVLVGIWQIRNARVHDRFVFISTNSSYNFYIGTVFGTSVLNDPNALSDLQEMRSELSEAEVASVLSRRTLDHISANPGIFIRGVLRKSISFWFESYNSLGTAIQLLILGFAIFSFIRSPGDGMNLAMVLTLVLITLAHALTFHSPRFFIPALIPGVTLLSRTFSNLRDRASIGG